MEEMQRSITELLTRVGTVTDEIQSVRKQMEDYGADLDGIKRKLAEPARPSTMPRLELRPNVIPILDIPQSSAAGAAAGETIPHADTGMARMTTTARFHTAPSSPTDHEEVRVRAPRHDFPKFHGDTPLLWIDQCLTYFDMFKIPSQQWVSMASLYLEGNAALWYQSHKRRNGVLGWSIFTLAILEEFGQDEYDGQMSKLMQLRPEWYCR